MVVVVVVAVVVPIGEPLGSVESCVWPFWESTLEYCA